MGSREIRTPWEVIFLLITAAPGGNFSLSQYSRYVPYGKIDPRNLGGSKLQYDTPLTPLHVFVVNEPNVKRLSRAKAKIQAIIYDFASRVTVQRSIKSESKQIKNQNAANEISFVSCRNCVTVTGSRSHEETILLSQMVLNDNSVHWLNRAHN